MKRDKNILLQAKDYIIKNPLILIVVVIAVVTGAIQPRFLSAFNIVTILRQASLLGILSVSMTFVIVSGGIDLSVGSLMGLTSVVVATLYKHEGVNIWVGVVIGLCVGALSGFLIGTLINRLKVPPFLATLAFLGALRGIDLVITDSQPINGFPENFLWLGRGLVLRFPVPGIIWIVLVIAAAIFQRYHSYGRYVYAVGGNTEAAKYSGINVTKIILITYILNGLLASLSGILYTARLDSGQPMLGHTYELLAIAAVCSGGTSLMGGRGTVFGSAVGAVLVAMLYNAMSLLGLSTFLQEIAVGIILIAAVSITVSRTSRKMSLA
jgi:ribose/xylose/arabinose/galactoside ABC-type transport system permease subunit